MAGRCIRRKRTAGLPLRALAASALVGALLCAATAAALGPDEFDRTPRPLPGAPSSSNPQPGTVADLAASEAGDRRAQSRVALRYLEGRGVTQSDTEAFRWFQKAAVAGEASAQHYLGLLYLSGTGTPVDLAEASIWLRRCAELADEDSVFSLGWFAISGDQLPPGAVQTAALFRNTAEMGHAGAQLTVAMLRRDQADPLAGPDAATWLREAAEQGLPEAQYQLALAYLDGDVLTVDGLDGDLGKDSLERRWERAAYWFHRAAAQGDGPAMRNYAVALHTGRGVARDDASAFGWFLLAEAHGSRLGAADVRALAPHLSDADRAAGRRFADRFRRR